MGGIEKKLEETYGNNGYVHYLDCGDGFTGVYVHMSKLAKL